MIHKFKNPWYSGQQINNIPIGFWEFYEVNKFGKHKTIFYLW